jgi:hypothetical protein
MMEEKAFSFVVFEEKRNEMTGYKIAFPGMQSSTESNHI